MARHYGTLLTCALLFASVTALRALEPLSFQEISLLLRTGESPQMIVNEAARRKVLGPLAADETAKLRALGASDALLASLASPALQATAEEKAAYLARRKLATSPQPLPAPAALPNAAPAVAAPQAIVLPDTFTPGLEAAKKCPPKGLKYTDAFSLSQLPQAKAKAMSERKPLGFVMVWDVFFKPGFYSPRKAGNQASALHFYEAFKDSLVLVFVRHENELDKIPEAVRKGFFGPDEGGAAPNLCVTDATASEYIAEIPLGGAKSDGPIRDQIFADKAAVVRRWLSFHPAAVAAQPAR